MEQLIQVRLREAGHIIFCNIPEFPVKLSDWVIIEKDKTTYYGQIIAEPAAVSLTDKSELPSKILRLVNEIDTKQVEENKSKTKNAFSVCQKHIEAHKLDMKLVDAEYSFDRTKTIFYFTAEGRIDFRNLIKDLAKVLRTRIELRQIGVRDEAKLFGGVGSCGKKLCCATFLKDFDPVTIKMAKEQGLPLNPPKISGACGRLMCCLAFEYKTYKELLKDLPKEGDKINTSKGSGKVLSVNALKHSVIVELETGAIIEIKL